MATLNIKNFPAPLYEKLRERAERERRSLAQEIIHLLLCPLGTGLLGLLKELGRKDKARHRITVAATYTHLRLQPLENGRAFGPLSWNAGKTPALL